MKKIGFLISFLFWTTSFQTHSQTIYELEDIVISAGNSPILSSETATSHTVITSDEIDKLGNISVGKILSSVPGLAVSSSGGSSIQVRIRGSEANHVLVLIDGVSAAAGDGEYNFSGLSALDIDRIEILRGPQTVFFGPSASSGLINIITKSASKSELKSSVTLGSHEGFLVAKSFSIGRLNNSFSYFTDKDKGYDYSFNDGEKDGTQRNTLKFRSQLEADNGLKTEMLIRETSEKYDVDDINFAATSFRNYLTDSTISGKKNESLGSLTLSRLSEDTRSFHEIKIQKTKFHDFYNGAKRNSSDKTLLRYHFQRSFSEDPIIDAASTGSVIFESSTDRNKLSPIETRRNKAVGTEIRHRFTDKSTLQYGARFEDGNKFESSITWKAALKKTITESTALLVDVGTGVVNPTYFEIYGGWGIAGNPNLKPEKNKSFSMGLEYQSSSKDTQISAVAFQDILSNEISTNWGTSSIFNETGKSTRKGVELTYDKRLAKDIKINGNYTFLIAKNADSTLESRRPRHSLNFGLEYFFGPDDAGSLRIKTKSSFENYDQDFSLAGFPVNKLPDYTSVDVTGTYKLSEALTLTAEAENITDQEFYDVWGYRSPGRSFFIRLTKRW
jgi:vitamin B12 transporter